LARFLAKTHLNAENAEIAELWRHGLVAHGWGYNFGGLFFMKSFLRFALLALVLVMVALAAALTAMRLAIHGQEVAVPAIVGLAPAEAEHRLGGLGLQMEIERQYYSPQIPTGRIMSQLPQPGAKVRRGWQVRVAQSLGPMRIAIPDVKGESGRAAELNIQRRGLDVVSTAQMQIADAPADQVLAQNPPANATQVAAPKISLLVSAAADPSAFVMPSFVGQPLGSVSRVLQDAGFKLGNVTVAGVAPENAAGSVSDVGASAAPPQVSPASIVVSQVPGAGQRVVAGAMVNFEVR
jgi:eukaryotic-like serine/threonine-protein kinase